MFKVLRSLAQQSILVLFAVLLGGHLVIAAQLVAQSAEYSTVTVEVAGLRKPAEILVDKWGVPHIYAQGIDDAFFVQGFNAGRDRLFQIDLWRRRGLGRLAEVLGPEFVDFDKAARLFLYRGEMNREWASYGPNAKRIATAFVAGINAYIDTLVEAPDRLPIEFTLLGYEPAKWEASDVVRIRAHGLTGNLTSEVARANTVCKTDPQSGPKHDQVRARLEPPWDTQVPEGLDPCLPANVLSVFTLATGNLRITRAPENDGGQQQAVIAWGPERESHEESSGSNNWTIAPSKSSTGRPILANDPHRAYTTPSLRYIAHVSAPGFSVIGAGEPFLPGISIGHNGTIAFGLTRFFIDQQDLYAYELHPERTREYRYRQGWESIRTVNETIQVRNAESVGIELMFTRHGPVIYFDPDARRAYAVRTSWQEPGMAAYFGSASYMFAKDFRNFQRAMSRSGTPGLNYVYADLKGNIGWIPAGLAPVRPNWDGLLPVPGDGRYEWAGFWSSDKLPRVFNPASGYWATANQMNLPAGYPYQERKLGFEWVNGSRYTRIDEVLTSLSKVSIEDSLRLQNDVTSIPARRLVRLLASMTSNDQKTEAALSLLRGWDGIERADSAQAALMEVWISRHLGRAFLDAVLPRSAADAISSPDMAVLLEALEQPENHFATDPNGASGKRDRVLLTSLRSAFLDMEKLQGVDVKAWEWGKLHRSLPEHVMLDMLDADLRAKLQPGPFPAPGGSYTPAQSGYRISDFQVTSGASFRMVLDVGNWDNSRAVNYPGQSGNPGGPHYRDLTGMWLEGDYFPLLYTRAAVEKATHTRIFLKPIENR
jgi:penicillin G amidase